MLSILIPIYNHDVRKLVVALAEQCQKCRIRYQILCFDDGSKERYKKINRQLETIYGVSYLEFEHNMGRARIRNKLGFNAMYDQLLFLDCDSQVISKKYIKKYLEVINTAPVIYGGTIYTKRKPRSKKKQLHWKYGSLREKLPIPQRQAKPHLSFRSNNFSIDRNTFLAHSFDEDITGYGHEDTLFAYDLGKAGVNILHIDNPVQHGGLEETEVFISKVKESTTNLALLLKDGKPIETNLTRFYSRLQSWDLLPMFRWFYNKFESYIMSKIRKEDDPSLRALDLFKLKVFDDEMKH